MYRPNGIPEMRIVVPDPVHAGSPVPVVQFAARFTQSTRVAEDTYAGVRTRSAGETYFRRGKRRARAVQRDRRRGGLTRCRVWTRGRC